MFKIGDKVTIINRLIGSGNCVIEGEATIKRVINPHSNYCEVVFEDEPDLSFSRLVNPEVQEDPEKYVREANEIIQKIINRKEKES